MDDLAALLKSVVANPDDDTVRLVTADFLEDHDDLDRAEFIRSSITLNNLSVFTISTAEATTLSLSPQLREYLMKSPDAMRGLLHFSNPNRGWGIPHYLYGIQIKVDSNLIPADPPESNDIISRVLARTVDSELSKVAARNAELLSPNYGLRFAIPLLEIMDWTKGLNLVGSWVFRRGFIEQLGCEGDEWIKRGKYILEIEPIRTVTLYKLPTISTAADSLIGSFTYGAHHGPFLYAGPNGPDPVLILKVLTEIWENKITFHLGSRRRY